jgi:hypothetical protein
MPSHFLYTTFASGVIAAVGCSKTPPPPAPDVPAASVSALASALSLDASTLEAPVDPPAPAADLRDDIERFTTVEACTKERSAIDPVLSDALSSIGYDTFVVDACRMLDAAKRRDMKACSAIDASMLQAKCQSLVALTKGDPEACPWSVTGNAERGRDPLCLAETTRDVRFCAATFEPDACAAIVLGLEPKCDPVTREGERARCKRDARRMASLVAAVDAGAPPSRTKPTAKLEVHALEGTDEPKTPVVDVGTDFLAGVVLFEQRDGTRFDLGVVRPRTDHVPMTPSAVMPARRPSFGATLFVPASVGTARVEAAALDEPALLSLSTPTASMALTAKLTKIDHARGGEVTMVLDGTIGSSPHGYRIHEEVTTFVRDIVKASALSPSILLPMPALRASP